MAYKIAFFGAKPYDIASFDKVNEKYNYDIPYYKGHLNPNNVVLTQDTDAVCIFVNDTADAAVIDAMVDNGVKLLALRCAGFNNVDLKAAKGKYISRMDGDDICLPERFAAEYETLETEKTISIVSTDMGYFDQTGIWGKISHPEYPKKKDFLYGSPFCHAPCMVRKEAYDAVAGYTEKKSILRVEDYHLWIKMYEAGYRGKNIPKQLYFMRDDRAAYKRRKLR